MQRCSSSTDRPLHPCARGPFAEPILFDELLDFPSGYQDPQQTISQCNHHNPPRCQSQADVYAASSLHEDSATASDLLGTAASCSWDQLSSFSPPCDSSGVNPVPFPSSTSPSSLASLTGDLLTSSQINSAYDTSDWSALSLHTTPMVFPCDDLSIYPSVSTGGLDVLTMSPFSQDIYSSAHTSKTMEKGMYRLTALLQILRSSLQGSRIQVPLLPRTRVPRIRRLQSQTLRNRLGQSFLLPLPTQRVLRSARPTLWLLVGTVRSASTK